MIAAEPIPRPGRYGPYGGRFVPELLMGPLLELEDAFRRLRDDPVFMGELGDTLARYAGRPTPLTEVPRYAARLGRARVLLKREDLLHTGAHKLNNALGQVLLARRMGKHRVVAETGAGQHGVATATAAARLGVACTVYMGRADIRRQELNVFRMRLLGAEVRPVGDETATLKEAVNEAMRDWAANVDHTHYVLGSALGPHPYPAMVRAFQQVIGQEARRQCLEFTGRLPRLVVACVGGGSNAIGVFAGFEADPGVELVGVEAGGRGDGPGEHAARFDGGRPGVLHGMYTYLLQDAHGQVLPTHSISAGLDYPAVGPEHAWLRDQGRARYFRVSDPDALDEFHWLARLEGIIPALESAHALAGAARLAPRLGPGEVLLVNLSGRGDKDVQQVADGQGGQL